MRFWDTSALLSLIAEQEGAPEVKTLVDEDPGIALWWATRVELASGLCRMRRENLVSDRELTLLLNRIESVANEADQMEPTEQLRTSATRLLRVHNLRAADALQLAAAIEWRRDSPMAGFVCFDRRLREAAEREGFTVLPE